MTIPYVKFEQDETKEYRKGLLTSQISLLTILRTLEAYSKLRKAEIVKKTILKRALREQIMKLNSLAALLPSRKMQGIDNLKYQISETEEIIKSEPKKANDIESQLLEIKEELSKL
jgi:hypothetical protein